MDNEGAVDAANRILESLGTGNRVTGEMSPAVAVVTLISALHNHVMWLQQEVQILKGQRGPIEGPWAEVKPGALVPSKQEDMW